MKKGKIINLFYVIKETKRYNILTIAVVTVILAAIVRQVVTYYLGSLVNIALNKSIEKAIHVFAYLLIGIVVLLVMDFINSYLFGKYTNESLYRIRAKTIKAVQSFPLTTISRYSTGDLLSRMNNDLGLIDYFFRVVAQDSIYKILIGLFAGIYGIFINYKVTILLIAVCSAINVLNYKMSKPIGKKQDEVQSIAGEVSSIFQDSINGHIEIKTFGLYDAFKYKFRNLLSLSLKKVIEMSRIECLWGAIEITASIGVQIGTVFLCLFFVIRNEMTIGDLIVFQQIQEMLRNIFNVNYINIRKAVAASERIVELWDEEPEKMEGKQKEDDKNAPIISLKDVSFSYKVYDSSNTEQEGKKVLDSISFDIERNESVALVGPSGCGKTTLMKIICGFLKPDSGQYLYKGFLYDDWDKKLLRRGISIVDQDAHIFPGSIFDNIASGIYGQVENESELDKQELKKMVYQAAEQSSLTDYINSLDTGYQTSVGELGSKLSGGQRQRVAIARAFVKNSDLLILDEPTSALDAQTEQEIQKSLDNLMKNRATLIIAHRLSTIKNVDRILVLNNGKIVEEGNHESLLNKKGLYYKLYQQQCGKVEELKNGA
ncbi:ABC transporter ATP-binding protein [Ruminiclostridium josui]|uniref:ABC transporter ATP-binding protein n=1 Tax=Ruminiclostridium josui TaxID=1499 RepID=UPI000466D529|nr:ABC transporter ATP-binding protein [Ruminiclostridium josui]